MINNFKIAKNFLLKEFQCPCCKTVKIDDEVVILLQRLRDLLKKPIIITSGYRCYKHNKEVGGIDDSFHTQGLAVDVTGDWDLTGVSLLARTVGFRGIGIYRKKRKFLHLDLGPVRQWEGW